MAPVAGLNCLCFVTLHSDSITPEWEEMWITADRSTAITILEISDRVIEDNPITATHLHDLH